MYNILMAATEIVPFAKTGGLADVMGSLPAVLKGKNEVRLVMPKFSCIPKKYSDQFRFITSFNVRMSWRNQYCGIFEYEYNNVKHYFVDNEFYFGDGTIYSSYDWDIERFSFFTRAVMEMLPHIDYKPDILHCHDWQTGMIPLLLDLQYRQKDFYSNIRTVLTIHNLKYQGIYGKEFVKDYLELNDETFEKDRAGFFDQANFLKAGIVFADMVTTVSETYVQEIKYPYFGENLDSLLQKSSHKLVGILNGLDYSIYNPEKDLSLYENYDASNASGGKKANKVKLQEELDLPVCDSPMLGIVTRLVAQKGLDLVECIFDDLMKLDIQLVVLGTGEAKYESMFRHYQEKYPEKVQARITFDETLAHRIYAASDFFLMPSLFEPCGLGQLIALKYGTVPIVRETGGLKDTVFSYNEYNNNGNGFTFANYNAHDMLYTIKRALNFYNNTEHWPAIIKNAMSCDYSWQVSATKYNSLYNSILNK